jgi:hypothetical protein
MVDCAVGASTGAAVGVAVAIGCAVVTSGSGPILEILLALQVTGTTFGIIAAVVYHRRQQRTHVPGREPARLT